MQSKIKAKSKEMISAMIFYFVNLLHLEIIVLTMLKIYEILSLIDFTKIFYFPTHS